jgi:hypothetical protein
MQPRLSFVEPANPVLVDVPPIAEGWIHAIKQDGFPRDDGATLGPLSRPSNRPFKSEEPKGAAIAIVHLGEAWGRL